MRGRNAIALGVALAAGWLSTAADGTPPGLADSLSQAVSIARLRAHLAAFQRIADANGGTRVAGSPGYAASVRYVRETLRRAGYTPRIVQFPFVEYRELLERAHQLAPVSRSIRLEGVDYTPPTPRGGIRGRVVAARGDGCSESDFAGVRGRIGLAPRGACFTFLKAQNAARAGAKALLVFNTKPGPLNSTLGDPNASPIPVAAIEAPVARSLASGNGEVSLEIRTETHPTSSTDVVADNASGGRVLILGAHLDSVADGPGINDNGTGAAALLEIARLVHERAPGLAVRFAFWGAEEFGLFGSRSYAAAAARNGIAGYLNFDMLGSRQHLRAVYKGPFASRFLAYFGRHGLRAVPVDLAGTSDHFSFDRIGVPTGGLFAGDDPCYHRACDRLEHVDLPLFLELTKAAAYAAVAFAP